MAANRDVVAGILNQCMPECAGTIALTLSDSGEDPPMGAGLPDADSLERTHIEYISFGYRISWAPPPALPLQTLIC
jgi:hypothetical protein